MMNVNYAKVAGAAVVCALAVMGCERKEKTSKEPELNAPPTVTPLEMGCDDASTKNALIKVLSNDVNKQIATLVRSYSDADTLALERRTQQRLSGIGIDLQNVRTEDGMCQADLHVTLPMTDVSYANRQFLRDGSKSIAERAADLGIKLNNDNFITAPLSYRVVGDGVQLDGGFATLGLIAQVSTSAAYGMANDEQRINLAGRPAPTVRPLPPTQVARPTADLPTQSASVDTQSMTAHEQPSQTTAAQAPSNSEVVDTPKQHTTPIVDDGSQMTIVETDETY